MKAFKKVSMVLALVVLLVPIRAFAAEHEHVFERETTTHVSSSDAYCKIYTYVTTETCKVCGHRMVSTTVENVPHDMQLVCVDPVNNGYQNKCTQCGRTAGDIIYPYSLNMEEEK